MLEHFPVELFGGPCDGEVVQIPIDHYASKHDWLVPVPPKLSIVCSPKLPPKPYRLTVHRHAIDQTGRYAFVSTEY